MAISATSIGSSRGGTLFCRATAAVASTIGATALLLLLPGIALADNCSSLGDCWSTAGGAASAAAGAAFGAIGGLFGGFGGGGDGEAVGGGSSTGGGAGSTWPAPEPGPPDGTEPDQNPPRTPREQRGGDGERDLFPTLDLDEERRKVDEAHRKWWEEREKQQGTDRAQRG